MRFAKLFDLACDEQVLAVLSYNESKDQYEVKISSDFDGYTADVTYSFSDKDKAEEALNEFNEDMAIEFRNAIKNAAGGDE